jgi:hypothetical protein
MSPHFTLVLPIPLAPPEVVEVETGVATDGWWKTSRRRWVKKPWTDPQGKGVMTVEHRSTACCGLCGGEACFPSRQMASATLAWAFCLSIFVMLGLIALFVVTWMRVDDYYTPPSPSPPVAPPSW